jgi:hypothetical protein
MQVVSKIKETQVVHIILEDGSKDSVSLQGRGRLTLPAGSILDPSKEHQLKVTVTGKPLSSVTGA